MRNVNWFCDLMGYKLYWYQKLIMRVFHGKHIVHMKKVLNECKNNEELFTRLPNPDGIVDLHMNQKMFEKVVEPFRRTMEDK